MLSLCIWSVASSSCRPGRLQHLSPRLCLPVAACRAQMGRTGLRGWFWVGRSASAQPGPSPAAQGPREPRRGGDTRRGPGCGPVVVATVERKEPEGFHMCLFYRGPIFRLVILDLNFKI